MGNGRRKSTVEYNEVGTIVAKKINAAYIASGQGAGQFMADGSGWFDGNNVSKQVLQKAEQTLTRLSDVNSRKVIELAR